MGLPNGDWTTLEKCIEDCENAYKYARISNENAEESRAGAAANIDLVEAGLVKNALSSLYGIINWNYKTCKFLINYFPGNEPDYTVPFFWTHYSGGTDYELTAAKIMAAWIDADADVRMMTVMTLDELRREAWNKEFFSFKITAPGT